MKGFRHNESGSVALMLAVLMALVVVVAVKGFPIIVQHITDSDIQKYAARQAVAARRFEIIDVDQFGNKFVNGNAPLAYQEIKDILKINGHPNYLDFCTVILEAHFPNCEVPTPGTATSQIVDSEGWPCSGFSPPTSAYTQAEERLELLESQCPSPGCICQIFHTVTYRMTTDEEVTFAHIDPVLVNN